MDLKHLRTFVAVAELGTVSRAALQLRTTQPALSRQIADLEREFGIALFCLFQQTVSLIKQAGILQGNTHTVCECYQQANI